MAVRSERRRQAFLMALLPAAFALSCGGGNSADDAGTGGSGASGGSSNGKGSGGSIFNPGSGGTSSSGSGSGASSGSGSGGFKGCTGTAYEQETTGSLDIYFVFDRTGSMGTDCEYVPGGSPPVDSKACFATYALADYLINAPSAVDRRLAFQFMSQPDDCNGAPYETPLVPLTRLPLPSEHQLIRELSDETFEGGLGTHIEGALRGLTAFTESARTNGREMIGVLMTDGDPNGCEDDMSSLSSIISDHYRDTGIRTFVIGMEGATDDNLEQLGRAGGADPHDDWCGDVNEPCHYWNVEDGAEDAIASALSAIVEQAAPIPCTFEVAAFSPPSGQAVDFGKVNVTLTGTDDMATTIGQVANADACPDDVPAWYYDNPASPQSIELCQNACDLVSNATRGARVNVVVGCQDTVIVPPVR
ncbi:MAG TPA: vWA domain-containing protein [Polyangiaceae bacterium]